MKVLIVMGSGGHTAQMMRLMRLLGNRYEYEYLINDDDVVTPKKIKGRVHKVPKPRVFGDSIYRRIMNTTKAFMKAFVIMPKFKAVISAGPGLTVPVFYAAKMMGKKTIYLESWSRAHTPSVSGKLCYPVADLFFVQWPEMKKCYPKAVYAGRLS